MVCLEKDLGSVSTTASDTLSDFIRWCDENYPANRTALIFWDHGGGSVSGFGYDEKFVSSGSMTLGEIGKLIIDDFVDTCAKKCPGQAATLSIVDLAEAEAVIPAALADFSSDTYDLIKNGNYDQVSNARSGAREFGSSSKIDQVDLVHLAKNMNTEEGDALANALLSTVKYNRTSSGMANSYGLSIYFPFRKASMVDDAVGTYEDIGLDDEYVRCIEAFASMEVSGQAAGGGTSSPLPSLIGMLGSMAGSSSGSSAGDASEMIGQLLGTFLSGNVSSIAGLTQDNIGFLSGRALDDEAAAEYISSHYFDGTQLTWTDTENGAAIVLPEDQWELVQTLQANMFYDDGEGYIDLGLDTVYDFDENGNLLAPEEMTWLAVNSQPVAYCHESTVSTGDDYMISGYIPVLYNGDRAELIVVFTDEEPYGTVSGVRRVYADGETATAEKTMDTLSDGDVTDFICDYYSYDGEYLDSYMLGDALTVDGELEISDVYIDEQYAELPYLFTDIYNQHHWSEPVR